MIEQKKSLGRNKKKQKKTKKEMSILLLGDVAY